MADHETFPVDLQLAYSRFVDGIHRAETILDLFESGKDRFRSHREEQWKTEFTRFREFVDQNPQLADSTSRELAKGMIAQDGRAPQLAAQEVEAARVAALAGALVLAHSALEALLIDALDHLASANRAATGRLLGQRKVAFAALAAKGVESAFLSVKSEWLRELEGRPILAKWSALMEIEPGAKVIAETHKAQTNIQNLDTWRNEAAHKQTTQFASAPVASTIKAIKDLGLHVLALTAIVINRRASSAGSLAKDS